MVQWLRLKAPKPGGPGLIPGWWTRFHMPQLRVFMLHEKIPRAGTVRVKKTKNKPKPTCELCENSPKVCSLHLDSLLVWHILWVLKTVWWHISTIIAPYRIGSYLKNPLQYFLSFCWMPQNRRPDLPLAGSQVWLLSSHGVLEPTCSGKELPYLHPFPPCCYHMLWRLPCQYPLLSSRTTSTQVQAFNTSPSLEFHSCPISS